MTIEAMQPASRQDFERWLAGADDVDDDAFLDEDDGEVEYV